MGINPQPDITGYATLRRDLIHLADEENKTRLALIEIQKMKQEAISKLINKADSMFSKAIAEHTADGSLKKEFKPDTNVVAVAEHMGAHQRACSHCGQPGHRITTCPSAHLPSAKTQREMKTGVGQAKIVKAEYIAVKPKRKVSPERKAQLVETLKKARAARGKK